MRISAGPVARRNTPVSFPLPATDNGVSYVLTGTTGTLPVQISDGMASDESSELGAGATATFQLSEATGSQRAASAVAADRHGDDVRISSGKRPIAQYVGGAGVLPAGDIKPIFSAGVTSTRSTRLRAGSSPPTTVRSSAPPWRLVRLDESGVSGSRHRLLEHG